MYLAEAKDGVDLIILDTEDESLTIQILRFGIDSGTKVKVEKNIRGGPVIISRNNLEIAIGRDFAKSIRVKVID